MSSPSVFPLDAIRTDGWFERIGESVGSFQALCDIVGERFFAFSMIAGARITALTVDRRSPDNTLVDFSIGGSESESERAETQRLTLADFRRRLVGALVGEEPLGPAPTRVTDTEAIQLFIGVRYLLLAPIYGYSLQELRLQADGAELTVLRDGLEQTLALDEYRMRIRSEVRRELDRVARRHDAGSAIDLSRVAKAASAAERGDHRTVLELLGAWPAPLTIFLRTPEGQAISVETRALIARGLGLLGSACVALGDAPQGEEVLRLAIQYAGDTAAAGDAYARLGDALLDDDRAGEAIGPLRRAVNLGGDGRTVWVSLARALLARQRYLATWAAVMEAEASGAPTSATGPLRARVEAALGPALSRWQALAERCGPEA